MTSFREIMKEEKELDRCLEGYRTAEDGIERTYYKNCIVDTIITKTVEEVGSHAVWASQCNNIKVVPLSVIEKAKLTSEIKK